MRNKFKRLAILVGALMTMSVSAGTLILATSGCQPDESQEQLVKLSGTFYVDINGKEYDVTFSDSSFTFTIGGTKREGTYSYDGASSVTLTFAEGDTVSANLADGVLTFNYNGEDYTLLLKETYTVSYDLDGGTGKASDEVVNGRLLTKPADPVKDGSVFVGWYTDEAFTSTFSFNKPITGNMTLYARFVTGITAEEEFTVSFDSSSAGGEQFESVQTVDHCIYQLPEPTMGDLVFLGWWKSDYQDSEKLTAQVTDGEELTENTTLYAVWADTDSPAVSVSQSNITWSSMGQTAHYFVTITDAEGNPVSGADNRLVQATNLEFDFSALEAGDYTVSVKYNDKTTTAYYRNKALSRVSVFEVEGSTLFFNPVSNVEHYYLSYECGTSGHNHTMIDLGTATSYNFGENGCYMLADGMKFTVTATADGYCDSVSNLFTFERSLAQATNLKVDAATDVLSWDAVDNAAYYDVTVAAGGDEQTISNITGTELSLTQFYGDLQITVVPVNHEYNSPEGAQITYAKTRLATPSGLRVSGNSILWTAVEGAQSYTITVNGEQYTSNEASLVLEEVESDTISVTVQAVAADKANNSFVSQALNVTRSLTGVVYKNGVVSWNAVLGITDYGVRVNGGEVVNVQDGALSLPVTLGKAGVNTIEVCYYYGEESSEWVAVEVEAGTITLNLNDGVGGKDEVYYAVGDTINLSDITRTGYIFAGWFTAPENGQPVAQGSVFNGDVTYYAVWAARQYTVKFVIPEDEGEFADGSHTYETKVDFGSNDFNWPVAYSYDGAEAFGGWFTDPGASGLQYTDPKGEASRTWALTSDLVVYPHWLLAFDYVLINHPQNPSESAYTLFQGDGIEYLSEVTVPATYNDLPVVRIEGSCFSGCSNLEVINIPDSILTIFTGDEGANSTGSAFYNCKSLREVNIYDAGDQITGNYPVYYHSVDGVLLYDNPVNGETELAYVPLALTGRLVIPDGVTTIPVQVFRNTLISEIIVPASVTRVGRRAFYSDDIANVEFLAAAEGEEELPLEFGEEVFYSCTMKEVTLPSRLTEFDIEIFTSCDELEKVHFVGEGGNYTDDDGIVLTADRTTIVFCPAGRKGTYSIPSMVSKIGERAFYDCSLITEMVIPAYITYIGEEAFRNCSTLATLTFLGTADSAALTIDKAAFYNCSDLTSVVLPENLYTLNVNAFGGNRYLEEITLNASFADINYSNGAFLYESGTLSYVTTLNIGPKVPVIDINGIFGSTSLENVFVDPANENYATQDGVLFDRDITNIVYYPTGRAGAYVIPDTVTRIGASVFRSKTGLTSITIPASVTEIGEWAFYACTGLEEIIFSEPAAGVPAEPLTIGNGAFYNCRYVVDIKLPERLVSIGNEAFLNCAGFVSVVIPEGVKSIGNAAFGNCLALEEITLPASLESMGFYTEDYDYIISALNTLASEGTDNIDVFYNCSALREIHISEENKIFGVLDNVLYGKNAEGELEVLYLSPVYNTGNNGVISVPSTVTAIKDRAFYNSMGIQIVRFDDRTEGGTFAMGKAVFQSDYAGDSVLERVELPSGMTEIGDNMFERSALREVFIPNTVTRIGASAFYRCENLELVEFEEGGTEPLVIADSGYSSSGGSYGTYITTYGTFAGTAIKTITFPERTTEIGNCAFTYVSYSYYTSATYEGLPQLETVNFPSTIERIGVRAFAYTYDLKNVNFASGGKSALNLQDYAFYYSGIENISLPEHTSVIGCNAFSYSELQSIVIPASVTAIGSVSGYSSSQGGSTLPGYAFYRTESLKTITFEAGSKLNLLDGNYNFGYSAVASINLEDTAITELPSNTFDYAGSITSISLPATIEVVNDDAFYQATMLQSVEFCTAADENGKQVSNLKEIGDYAFAYSGLTSITFPESVNTITLGNNLFQNCKYLTSAHLSTSVTDIGNAFARASALRTITIADGNPSYKQAGEGQPLILSVSGTSIVMAYRAVVQEGDEGVYTIPEGFMSISDYAFSGQNCIKKLILPSSLTEIGSYAFAYCRTLEEIVFPEESSLTTIGTYAFASCFSLKTLTVPSSVTEIGNYAFSSCISLTKAVLPAQLDSIGTYLFAYDYALVSANVPSVKDGYTTTKGIYMFYNCKSLTDVTLAADMTVIPNQFFNGCTSLANVDLSNIETLGSSAFNACTSLKTVSVPKLKTFNASCFANSGLVSFKLPQTATVLGTSATSAASSATIFNNCSDLETVILHDKVTAIGGSVFRGCTSLKTIKYVETATGNLIGENGVVTLPDSITLIANAAFGRYTSTTTSDSYVAPAIEKVVLPAGLKTIGTYVFYNCTQLTSVSAPGLTLLGNYMFRECTALKEVELPDILKPGTYAFCDCTALEKVVLNDNIASIGNYMFQNCTSLNTLGTCTREEDGTISYGEMETGVARLPSGLTTTTSTSAAPLGTQCFAGTAFETVIIPASVTKLSASTSSATTSKTSTGCGVFVDCLNLKKVIMGNAMTVIGGYTFSGCVNLSTVQYMDAEGEIYGNEGELTLPVTVKGLASYSFANTAFTKVTVPSSVTMVGHNVFSDNAALKEAIYLSAACTTTATGSTASNNMFAECTALEKVVMNAAIKRLGSGVFSNCSSLKTLQLVTVGSTPINEITNEVITGNEGAITLGSSLTNIGDNAFEGTTIDAVVIPASVTTIGDNAFGTASATLADGNTSFIAQDGAIVNGSAEIIYVSPSLSGAQEIPEGVKIGAYALSGRDNLASVTLTTDQVLGYSFAGYKGEVILTLGQATTLPNYAFADYLGTSVTLPEGLTALPTYVFDGCANLTSVTIPSTVTALPNYAFRDCISLAEIVIPENITTIGTYVFAGCSALSNVTFNANITSIGTYAFQNCTSLVSITLPENLETASANMFNGCVNLKEVVIPSLSAPTAYSSSANLFTDCTSLETVVLGDGVELIPNYMFTNTYLKTFVVPANIETLGTYMFQNATMLETVYIPENLTTLPNYMFNGCTSLKNVITYKVDENGDMMLDDEGNMIVNEIEEGYADLSNMPTLGTSLFQNCTSITGVIFSDELTAISNNLFRGSGLVSVTIPGTATTVGTYAFAECPNLTTVVIEEGVVSFSSSTFRDSVNLTTVNLPSTVTTLGAYMFQNCTKIQSITVPASVVLSSSGYMFAGWTKEQKVTFYIYAQDSASNPTYAWYNESDATYEFVVVYE